MPFSKFVTAHTVNYTRTVNWVKYKYGATVLQVDGALKQGAGVTQGSYIIGNNTIEADPHNPLFQHEYGHYIQSQILGLTYYSRIGIPSARSEGTHDFHPVEQDANVRAFLYFNKHVDNFYDIIKNDGRGWDFYDNPIDMNGTHSKGQIIDYKNPVDLLAINKLLIPMTNLSGIGNWMFDVLSWGLPIIGPIWRGLDNANYYNKQ